MSEELIVKDNNSVIARAELDVQITTAKAYPRDPKRSMENALALATMDEETAQSCFYVLPRKDKDGNRIEIKGASIRLAEIMASSWGNLHAATRILEVAEKYIITEGVAWDLESNTKIAMPNKVSIWFGEDKKKNNPGYRANNDMQTMLTNASSAKALRNAIFKVVPKALVDRILEKAMTFSVGDQKSVNKKTTEVIEKLVKMGIDKQAILDYYEHKTLSEFTVEDLRSLIGVGTGIKEGMIKIEEVFSITKDEENPVSANERMNQLLASKKQIESVNTETGEIKN